MLLQFNQGKLIISLLHHVRLLLFRQIITILLYIIKYLVYLYIQPQVSKDDRMLVIGNLNDPPLRHFPNQQSRSTSKPSSNLEHRSILVKCSSSQKGAWHDFYKVGISSPHADTLSTTTLFNFSFRISCIISFELKNYLFDLPGFPWHGVLHNLHESS